MLMLAVDDSFSSCVICTILEIAVLLCRRVAVAGGPGVRTLAFVMLLHITNTQYVQYSYTIPTAVYTCSSTSIPVV